MKWMTPFLEQGNASGKIICPNKKCSAKLGNYYWAGTFCSCQQWVIPVRSGSLLFAQLITHGLHTQAFCISRSKVDEVA